jgi:glycosyltransferase involved in cell wall biosynthesis
MPQLEPLPKLASVTAVFPAYNDAGTIPSMVIMALHALPEIADDYEVVVVNDGSRDRTAEMLAELEAHYPRLRVITHPANRGYGAALRSGFGQAAKEWIFYTDGDAQYDPHEMRLLALALRPDIDIVNGYKISRSDPLHRVIIGRVYHHFVRIMFGLPLRDTDCDFRLFRRSLFNRVALESDSGTIALELVKKFHDAGARFVEVPVHHYHRAYGQSQFFNFRRLVHTAVQLSGLWWKLVVMARRAPPAAAPAVETPLSRTGEPPGVD